MSEPTFAYLVARLDRILKARLEETLEASGITLAEFTALSVIATRPGLSNARLARRSLVTPQAMHRVMLSLEEAGYVARTASPDGGRALGAAITEAGTALLDRLRPETAATEDELLGDLSSADRARLVGYLQTIAKLDR